MKMFPLEQVLTVTTGKLLCHIDDAYKLLDYLTGDTLFTHQLPRARDFCGPLILAQYPELAKVNFAGMCHENYYRIFEAEKRRLNLRSEYELSPFPGWQVKDPVQEAEEIFGAERVITVMV